MAKLRMHTDATLEHLELLIKEFGLLMRQFCNFTCPLFETAKLPYELAVRNWQCQHVQEKTTHTCLSTPYRASSQKGKTLNLLTSKFHFLEDYVQSI